MTAIRVRPLTQWAKNRVRQHGDVFIVRGTGPRGTLCESLGKTWKGPSGPEKWLGWFDAKDVEFSETADCEKCEGEGWLWGRELAHADEATYADSMTRYTCDRCRGSCVDPGDDE